MDPTIQPRAWTGGSPPRPIAEISHAEYAYALQRYREDCETWRAYWRDSPDADVAATFWGRARHDAHATFRE